MEIPEISMISDFVAGMKCLRSPSLISSFFSHSDVGKVPQMYSFWKWGALILALAAIFRGIITRIKFLIIQFRTVKSLASSSSEPLLQFSNDDFDFSEDDSCSLASSEDERDESASLLVDREIVDEDFRVAGSSIYSECKWKNGNSKLRRRCSSGDRFSWSDFATGKNVVKLWDSLGVGLDFEDSSKGVVSIWGLSRDQKVSNFIGGCSAMSVSSPTVILSTELNKNNSISLGVYDARVGCLTPTIYAEWKSPVREVVGIRSGGVEKFYVKDGVTGALTVGDMRKVKTPLENVKEFDEDTWWDANAVIVEDDEL